MSIKQASMTDPAVQPHPHAMPTALPAVNLAPVWSKLAFWVMAAAIVSAGFGIFQLFIGFINFGWGTLAGILELVIAFVLFRMYGRVKKIGRQQAADANEIQKLAGQLVLYFRLQTAFVFVFGLVVVMLVLTIVQFLTDWDWLLHLVKTGKKMDKLVVWAEKAYGIVADWFGFDKSATGS